MKFVGFLPSFNHFSDEQTDLRINEVVGMELTLDANPAKKDLNGVVHIYLVHSHELFLRDVIDAKGHQGVKDDSGNFYVM